MDRLLLATTNRGKLDEIRLVLAGLRLDIRSLDALPPVPPPEETGHTFAENARQKATYYAAASGWPTVAEDSGLAIDALDGAPGVHSARFPGTTYEAKFAGLFQMLDDRGLADSTARFVCAVALARGGDIVFEAEGIVEGVITRQPRGSGGFG